MGAIKEKVRFYLDDCSTTAGKLIELFLLLVNLALLTDGLKSSILLVDITPGMQKLP